MKPSPAKRRLQKLARDMEDTAKRAKAEFIPAKQVGETVEVLLKELKKRWRIYKKVKKEQTK